MVFRLYFGPFVTISISHARFPRQGGGFLAEIYLYGTHTEDLFQGLPIVIGQISHQRSARPGLLGFSPEIVLENAIAWFHHGLAPSH